MQQKTTKDKQKEMDHHLFATLTWKRRKKRGKRDGGGDGWRGWWKCIPVCMYLSICWNRKWKGTKTGENGQRKGPLRAKCPRLPSPPSFLKQLFDVAVLLHPLAIFEFRWDESTRTKTKQKMVSLLPYASSLLTSRQCVQPNFHYFLFSSPKSPFPLNVRTIKISRNSHNFPLNVPFSLPLKFKFFQTNPRPFVLSPHEQPYMQQGRRW